MPTKQQINAARERVAQRRERDRAARLAGASHGRRRSPDQEVTPPAPKDERPQAMATAPPTTPPALLSRADLKLYYGINYTRVHLYKKVIAGQFPAPVLLGGGSNGSGGAPVGYGRKCWKRTDIEKFIENLDYVEYGSTDIA